MTMTKHPRTRVAIPAALTFAIALTWAAVGHANYAGGGKDADKGNDCLIGYQGIIESDVTVAGKKQSVTCMDCDPACDKDGAAEANGSCTFEVGACINQPGVENCTPPEGLSSAKAKAKVAGVKGGIDIELPQLLEGSACGALLEMNVPLKKNGTKDGKGKVTLKAQVKKDKDAGILKKRKDTDKLTYVCTPLPEGQSCPITTTTTSTTTSTSTTLPPCGDGDIDPGEVCDPNANPTGCNEGDTCLPDCSECAPCVAAGPTDPAGLTFTTGTGTANCGSTGFAPTAAVAPFGGVLNANSCTCAAAADCGTGGRCAEGHCTAGTANRIACTSSGDCAASQVCEASTVNLGLGCLYIGGGVSTVPGGVTPDTAPSRFSVQQVCNAGNTLLLGGTTGDQKTCTSADGPTKYCANGNPGNGGGACTNDDDCRPNCVGGQCVNGAPGSDGNGTCVNGSQCGSGAEGTIGQDGLICVPTANCYFGPPLPVKNGPLSTCVQNVFDEDASGSADIATGSVAVSYTLSSRVHFTSTAYPNNPCPTCVAGLCDAGPNEGQACVGVGVDGTTHDCPPDGYFFLAPLAVALDPLTTGTSTIPTDGSTSPDGIFCPQQGNAGAFAAPSTRRIAMQGTPTSTPLDTSAQNAVMVSAFCIPRTGNVLIDGAANLPGPGATSLGGTLQLIAAP
jgi:hypothetical protein